MLRKLCLILIAGVVLVACGANTEINATIEGVELPATWTVTPEDINVVFESPTPDESIALDQHESVATFVAQITAKPTNLPSATIDPAMVDYLTQKALTPTHTDTPVPTLTPSLTPTQVAPLQAHTFVPEDLLIEMTIGCGDGGCDRPFANNPILYLYANGLLVKFPDWDEAPVYTYLSRKEMCRVLNTIDQTGFFDYDDGEYQSPWDGGGGLYFNISTWESNSTALSMFWYFVDEEKYQEAAAEGYYMPVIAPAMRDVYNFLMEYDPGGWKYYEPDRVVFMMYGGRTSVSDVTWPFDPALLMRMVERFEGSYAFNVLVEGEQSALWLETLELYSSGIDYAAEGYYVGILGYRYLLPHERENRSSITISAEGYEYENVNPGEPISCKVIDGVYEIP